MSYRTQRKRLKGNVRAGSSPVHRTRGLILAFINTFSPGGVETIVAVSLEAMSGVTNLLWSYVFTTLNRHGQSSILASEY